MRRRARFAVPLSVAPTVPIHEPDLVAEHKEAIIEALRWAWAELLRDEPQLVRSGHEENVTVRLQELLNERRNGKRRVHWLNDFETVTRGESQKTVGQRLGKKPDLTFRPPPYATVRNTTRWGWFVECKIINGVASVTAYRDAGVMRFSSGEYAAWMPSSMMLAYVRDGSSPVPILDGSLKGHVGTTHHGPGPTADRSVSVHDRSILRIACVDVALTHLWLVAP